MNMQDRRMVARRMQSAGKGVAGLGQMIEVATDFLEEPRLLDAMDENAPGPAGLGLIARLRKRFGRQR